MNILGILASHGGSNLQVILDACALQKLPARVGLVISNNRSALALERARQAGVPTAVINATTHPDEVDRDAAIRDALLVRGVTRVALAGYMKKLGPATLAAYRGRIVNIHPALLPRYGGKGMYGRQVHAAVLAAGERETGVTVHLVDEHYDHGPILAQERVPVHPGDTVESLAARVLAVEHRLYVDTLRQWLLEG